MSAAYALPLPLREENDLPIVYEVRTAKWQKLEERRIRKALNLDFEYDVLGVSLLITVKRKTVERATRATASSNP